VIAILKKKYIYGRKNEKKRKKKRKKEKQMVGRIEMTRHS
jgi:hypothetical protein